MGYVQVDQGIVTHHRKTLWLARLLGESRYAVVGRLVALWSWSLDRAISGELRDVDAEMLAGIMGWQGRPAELFEGLISAGFLDITADGQIRIHNWWAYKRENPGAHEEWRRLRPPTLAPVLRGRDGYACVYCDASEGSIHGDATPGAKAMATGVTLVCAGASHGASGRGVDPCRLAARALLAVTPR